MNPYIGYLSCFLLFLSCGGIRDKQMLEESDMIKQEIQQSLTLIKQQLPLLTQHANSINIQGRALTTEEIAITARISGVQESLDAWQQQYQKAQELLQHRTVLPENQLNGYKAFKKELRLILQRLEKLLVDI